MPKKDDLVLQALTNFEKKLDSVDSKVNQLDSRLDSVDKTLVKQEANLGEHMRRTDMNEQAIKTETQKREEQIAPLKKHVSYMEGALKALGVLAMVVTIIAGLVKILGFLG